MSWYEEFNKLSLTVKNAILSLAVIIPFWLISIYLLNKPLYHTQDYLIIGAFCFCFSATWFFLNLLIASIVVSMNKQKRDINAIYTISAMMSVLYLSLAIIISHYNRWSFNTFLIIGYSYIVVVLLKAFIRSEIKRYRAKKQNNFPKL
jgi:predicted MFS family arabinose efflux permease